MILYPLLTLELFLFLRIKSCIDFCLFFFVSVFLKTVLGQSYCDEMVCGRHISSSLLRSRPLFF